MVCRSRRDDTKMVRVGRSPGGTWYPGRGTGRGVWWCREATCEQALQAGQVARALRGPVSEGELADLKALMAGSGFK